MRKYIGIDIGKLGAYYIMGEDGSEIKRGPTPMITKKEEDNHSFSRWRSRWNYYLKRINAIKKIL